MKDVQRESYDSSAEAPEVPSSYEKKPATPESVLETISSLQNDPELWGEYLNASNMANAPEEIDAQILADLGDDLAEVSNQLELFMAMPDKKDRAPVIARVAKLLAK